MLSQIVRTLFVSHALIASFTVAPFEAQGGQEWTCKKNELIRRIVVVAEVYGKPPCTALYSKPSEKKPDKEIARAKHDFPLCEKKADELALKLQNASWECSRVDS